MERRLVLVHLHSHSGAKTRACRASTLATSEQGHRPHVFLNPHHVSTYSHQLREGNDSEHVHWPLPKAGSTSSPLQTPVANLDEVSCLDSP